MESKIYVVFVMLTIIVSAFGPSMICTSTSGGILACTATEAVLARDYELLGNQTGVVYKSYPLEWPFMSGAFIQTVNEVAGAAGSVVETQLTQLYLTSILLGLISVLIIFMYFMMDVDWKRAMLFYVLAPIVIEYGWLETLQMALFVAGLLTFSRQRGGVAGVLFGLASGVKYFPILTLPVFLMATKEKKKLGLAWIGTFALGMITEIALSPANFLRSTSFYSTYGVEGSWIGLITGGIINYGHQTTWYIGTNESLGPPKAYQIVSIVLMLVTLVVVYRSKYKIVEKCILVFSVVFIFSWLTAPQFLIPVAALLPFSSVPLKLRTWILWFLPNIFCFTPLVFYLAERVPWTAALWMQIGAEWLLGLFLLLEVLPNQASLVSPEDKSGNLVQRRKGPPQL